MSTMYGLYFEAVAAAIVGVLVHNIYFVHGERDLEAPSIAFTHISTAILLLALKWRFAEGSAWQAIQQSLVLDAVYLAGLLSSIIFFRLLMSPLRHVPGPLRYRWTKLTHVMDMNRGQNCKDLHQLHRDYGEIVRTGPNEVTVFGTEAYYQVHGPQTTCTKGAYYDILHPLVSVQTTRNPNEHAHRRKVWDQAMGIRALEQIEPAVYELAWKLTEKLRDHEHEVVNMSQWIECYTFDIMGLAGMGSSFGNLARGGHPILSLFRRAHRSLGSFAPAPWLQHLLMSIPFVTRMKDLREYRTWVNNQLAKNIQDHSSTRTDVMKHVLDDAFKRGGVQKNINSVLGDFTIAVVAGNDPPWQNLVNLIYYLTSRPEHAEHIRCELAHVDLYDYNALQKQSHLNACLYETLRLHPGVPSGSYRLPPLEGITLNDVYIPAGTTIVTPQYSLQRNQDCFVKPDDWIPERFTSRPDLIMDNRAFLPWGTGKHTCLGKGLSLMEMRIAIALLITEFDFEFAPAKDSESALQEATDFFTAAPGPLQVILKARTSGTRYS